MNNLEFVEKLKNIAKNYKTLYVMGCFGSPMTTANKQRYIAHHSYNQTPTRRKMIEAATADTFGFDCVCLIKGVLWGWNGNNARTYGGAEYTSNGVPDIDADAMISECSGVTTNFANIEIGEAVWCKGHIGVYIGDGLAVECSPAWKNNVQITAVRNIGTRSGYNARTWTKHGKLPYIEYETSAVQKKPEVKTEGVCKVEVKVLKKGAAGSAVKALQLLLIGYGYSCGSFGADGSFGPATDSAVRRFQKDAKLGVDGSVGPATWAKLLGV